MKRTYITLIIVSLLMLTTSAQAAFSWNWKLDGFTGGTITGTLMTTEGYESGLKTITQFIVTDNGDLNDVAEESYNISILSNTFDWDASGGDVNAIELLAAASGMSGLTEFICMDSSSFCEVDVDEDLVLEGNINLTPVPIPAAAWLFMSGLIGLVWKGRKARQATA